MQLSKPRQINKRETGDSQSIIEIEAEIGIPPSLKRIDEHSNSLKKLKYKEQFLQAIKDSQHYDGESPVKKKHKK